MEEEILEELQKEFEYIKIEVRYKTIKTYEIILELFLLEKGKHITIKTSFVYEWQNISTWDSNIGRIKHKCYNYITDIFKKRSD